MSETEVTAGPDRRLRELMMIAEQGVASPWITVFVGEWIYRGQLTSTHWFLETTRQHRQQSLEASREYRKSDKSARVEMQELSESIFRLLAPGGTDEDRDLTALNLVYVTGTSTGGTSIQIPAMRIPVPAVSSWAVVDFALPKPPSGGGVAVGVAVPLS